MDVPTCRNPACPEANIRKPYRPPPPPRPSPLLDLPPALPITEWRCGACGSVCEVVIEPDTEEQ